MSNNSTATTLLTFFGLLFLYKLAGTVLREYVLIPKLTILADIPNVGKPRKSTKFPGRAIVCGGSIGGLLAAAVCSDHFESVIVVEPEVRANERGHEIPSARDRRSLDGVQVPVSQRTRVMQYFVVHIFQPLVWVVLEKLFPTLHAALDLFGYHPIVMRIRFQYGGVYTEDPYTTSDIRSGAPLTLPITREAIETLIRHLVKTSKPTIQFCTGTVVGMTKSALDPDSIKHLTVRSQAGDLDHVAGDLVIDATGPTQAGYSKWLKSAGFQIPPDLREQYNPLLQYTTSVWHIPKRVQIKWPVPWGYEPGIIFGMQPDVTTGERRVLFLGIVDDDQLQITTGGWGMPGHVHSIEDVRAYTRDLNGSHLIQPWLWDLFDVLESHKEECRPYYADATVGPLSWIKYHEAQLPKNFVVVGDSNMKLNPVYGQGVTKVAMDVTTLDSVLRATPHWNRTMPSFSSRYFSKLAPRLEGLWNGTRAMDYGWDTTLPVKGEDLQHGAFLRKFGWNAIMLARKDPEIHSAWWHINMQLAPATDFFAPWFLFRMAKAAILS